MLDILDTMKRWQAEERAVALATVVKTWGSAPRREGSKMGITREMGRVDTAPPAMVGSVSGGCVEGAVVEEALAGLKDGRARLLKFGVADDMAWEVGLTCGGSIEVFVEPLDSLWWDALAELAAKDHFGVTVTIMDGDLIGEKVLLDAAGAVLYKTANVGGELLSEMRSVAAKRNKTGIVTMGETRVMVDYAGGAAASDFDRRRACRDSAAGDGDAGRLSGFDRRSALRLRFERALSRCDEYPA